MIADRFYTVIHRLAFSEWKFPCIIHYGSTGCGVFKWGI